MTTDFTLTIGSVLLAVALFILLWITGAGIIPILRAVQGLILEKQALARSQVASIEKSIAEMNNLPKTLVHDVASSIDVQVSDPWVLSTADVLSQGLQALRQILPVKDERISPEEVAEAANQVADFVKRLTDNVVGNLPDIQG